MTNSQKLHTAARRHCTEQYGRWTQIYEQIPPRSTREYTPQQLAVFPRYILLEAIQIEVERFDFENLPKLTELRGLFVLAAQVATPSGGGSKQEIARAAETETRAEFTQFIEDFDVNSTVEPLPYRRVLSPAELSSVGQILRERWGATEIYYYPLDDAKGFYAPTLFAFDDVKFDAAVPEEKLAEILRAHGVKRIYELHEWREAHYFQDVEAMEPYYNGAEVFISSDSWDWLFYASHESSVTTGGWLTQAIRDAWPDWETAKYAPHWWQ